jgi:hypothetical protein
MSTQFSISKAILRNSGAAKFDRIESDVNIKRDSLAKRISGATQHGKNG